LQERFNLQRVLLEYSQVLLRLNEFYKAVEVVHQVVVAVVNNHNCQGRSLHNHLG
jgi:hypothetical protein